MFAKKLLVIMLLLSPFAFNVVNSGHQKSLQTCPAGQCYCSVKCGPRKIGSVKGDNPFVDPKTGIYFCQERDRQLYSPNNCAAYHNACTAR